MLLSYLGFVLNALFQNNKKSEICNNSIHCNKHNFVFVLNYKKELLNSETVLKSSLPGAGSRSGTNKTLAEIVKNSSKPIHQSIFLACLAQKLKAKNILELGTSLGLSTSVFASLNRNSNIKTIEGNQELQTRASDFFIQNNLNNIQSICGLFDEEIEKFDTQTKFDIVFVDGNHTYEASMKYFEFFKNRMNYKGLIIFDDIYWSKGMKKAWKEIKEDANTKSTIDFFSFGIVNIFQEQKQKHQKIISKLNF